MSKPKAGGASLVVDDGTYPMTIKSINDLGTQPKKSFGKDGEEDEEDKEGPQLFIEAEMPEYEAEGETVVSTKAKPSLIGMWLNNTASSDRSNLYKLIKACGIKTDPANTDLDELLGKSFNGEVGHTKSGKPKVKAFMPLTKGQKVGKTFASTRSYYLDETFDAEAFESAPKFIQDKAVTSKEYEAVEARQSKKGKKK